MNLKRVIILSTLFIIVFTSGIFVVSSDGDSTNSKIYWSLTDRYYDYVLSVDKIFEGNYTLSESILPSDHTCRINLILQEEPQNYRINTYLDISYHFFEGDSSDGYVNYNVTFYFNNQKAYKYWARAQIGTYGWSFELPGIDPSTHEDWMTDFSSLHKGTNNITVLITFWTDIEKSGISYVKTYVGPFKIYVKNVPLGERTNTYVAGIFLAVSVALVADFITGKMPKRRRVFR